MLMTSARLFTQLGSIDFSIWRKSEKCSWDLRGHIKDKVILKSMVEFQSGFRTLTFRVLTSTLAFHMGPSCPKLFHKDQGLITFYFLKTYTKVEITIMLASYFFINYFFFISLINWKFLFEFQW